jgi:acetyl-CoA carboxylase biotin carboxyl carrier protein
MTAEIEKISEIVRKLSALLDETGLTEIEYGDDGWHVRVSKAVGGAVPAAAVETASAAPAPADGPPAGALTSPMVGTAYLSGEPGAAPFVEVGDEVTEGQTLLLIEAMKTFNEIRAPRAGRITEILIESGRPVEFGDPLLIIS